MMKPRLTRVIRDAAAAQRAAAEIAALDLSGNHWIVQAIPCARQRTLAQNRMLWSCLTDLAEQADWHGEKLTPEEWKDLVTAALRRQKVVPGIDGETVVLGMSSSNLTTSEFSDLLDIVLALGHERDVVFHE